MFCRASADTRTSIALMRSPPTALRRGEPALLRLGAAQRHPAELQPRVGATPAPLAPSGGVAPPARSAGRRLRGGRRGGGRSTPRSANGRASRAGEWFSAHSNPWAAPCASSARSRRSGVAHSNFVERSPPPCSQRVALTFELRSRSCDRLPLLSGSVNRRSCGWAPRSGARPSYNRR